MEKIKQKELLVLILCLIIGFALRFYTFDQKSFWLDEVHTFNDSRDDLRGQITFYKENPTSLQAPLFFVVTHLFYPFQKPERDLRIIPVIFGTLSIPMIYFLSRLFSPGIALPCTLSLTFMTYHIYLSQDARSYSLLLFLGMASLYLFLKYLKTSGRRYLLGSGLVFSLLFYTSYSSIPFILFSQMLWFYRTADGVEPYGLNALAPPHASYGGTLQSTSALRSLGSAGGTLLAFIHGVKDHSSLRRGVKGKRLFSALMLNGVLLLLCLPWILFLAIHYIGQPIMEDPLQSKFPISFFSIFYGILHDWVPHAPLLVASVILLIVLPFFYKHKENAFLLMTIFFLPIGSLYAFCKLFNITHFITSRYFINFLPVFLVIIYLALDSIEIKFVKLKRLVRLKLLFVILFVASNLIILPFYYRSEKQDFKGLVTYLKLNLQEGDKIFCGGVGHLPVMLHYFGAYPKDRIYGLSFRKVPGGEIQFSHSFMYRNKLFTIYHSKNCCNQYIADGNRLWIVVEKDNAKKLRQNTFLLFKGYFDGSFLNFNKFPLDVSLYLFLWDPKSTEEKGIDLPIG